jgi:Kef-type K+ transport system membrane component KefB
MRRLAALLLVMGTAWAVVSGHDGAGASSAALAIGIALIAATLTGSLFERMRLPKITGYLVFGMLCGPYLASIITRPMARELYVINGLAIALIAFMAGLELNYQRLKPRLASFAKLGGSTLLLCYLGIFPLLYLAWPWLPIAPELGGLARAAVVAVVTSVIISFSPTVTIAVVAESRARGPFTEMVLALVVLADLALILLFTLSSEFARFALGGEGHSDVGLTTRLAWEIFGSFAFGALVGALFGLYLRWVGREVTVVLIAMCAILSGLGTPFHFEPLLAALAAGLVVENVAGASGEALKDAVERGSLPVLVVFFVAAGTSLRFDALAAIGVLALGVAVVRAIVVRAATLTGARLSGIDRAEAGDVWMGLVSQAGVTLGLAIIIARDFPDWGPRVQTLLVALIALHELVGPILFRTALARAGEIGRMDDPSAAGAAPQH